MDHDLHNFGEMSQISILGDVLDIDVRPETVPSYFD